MDDWSEVYARLILIGGYRDDWDGQSAAAPPTRLIDGARTLAKWLESQGQRPPHRVVAGVNGTIYFEWQYEHEYYEIEVNSPTGAEIRWVKKVGCERDDQA